MPAHHDFVIAFAASLTGTALPPGTTTPVPDETGQRFAVYRNNVAASLAEALAQRFAVIRRLVGAEFFAALAGVYAATHRPTSPVLHEWGESFGTFLDSFPPLAGYPYMGDVARIEMARGRAFHAADAPPINPLRLIGADPARLVLILHPSVQLLRLATPAVTIWTHNQPGHTPGPLTLAGAETALVLRGPGFDVPVFSLHTGDAVMIEQIAAGQSLHRAAEAALWAETGHDPQPLLGRLLAAGAITDLKEIQP